MDTDYIEIFADNEEEFMLAIEDYTVNDLKMMARCISRYINNKVHGHALYGVNKKSKTEPKWEDTEYSSSWSVEQTITVDEYLPIEEKCMDTNSFLTMTRSLDCCASTPAPCKAVAPIQKLKGWSVCTPFLTSVQANSMESDMNYNTTTTLEADTRKYLLNDLSNVETAKYSEAEKKFLPVTEAPKNGKELKAAIANGWIKTDVKDDTSFGWESWLHFVELQDPSKPRDCDGYNKAVAAITNGKKEAKRAIMVLPQADGLAALKAFEGATFH